MTRGFAELQRACGWTGAAGPRMAKSIAGPWSGKLPTPSGQSRVVAFFARLSELASLKNHLEKNRMSHSDHESMLMAVRHLQQGEWERAHDIVQRDETSPLSCWAHGIVHLEEGDVDNARYWFSRARRPFSKDVAAQLAALAAAVSEAAGSTG
jgi:hypothetical protein